jgi:hypothetical protein
MARVGQMGATGFHSVLVTSDFRSMRAQLPMLLWFSPCVLSCWVSRVGELGQVVMLPSEYEAKELKCIYQDDFNECP